MYSLNERLLETKLHENLISRKAQRLVVWSAQFAVYRTCISCFYVFKHRDKLAKPVITSFGQFTTCLYKSHFSALL
jgi:hypothetical protein